MKTVLFTLDSFQIGGVEAFVSKYCEILIANRYKVLIIGQRFDIDNPQKLFLGCEIIIIPGTFGYGLSKRIINLFFYMRTLNDVFQQNTVDYIHFSTTWSTLYSLCHWRTWRIKKIITFYGAYDLEVLSGLLEHVSIFHILFVRLKCMLRKQMQLLALLLADKIITFSQYSKKIITTHFSTHLQNKIIIIPGYVNTDHQPSPKSGRQKIFTIVNFGRIEPRKGTDLLLLAAKKLQEEKINFKLYIASPVNYWFYYPILELYEKLNLFLTVQFIHKVTNKQKAKLLQMADLFVMPSKDLETFGMTILESLAAAVPVLGTPSGAIPEILSKFDSRFLCKDITGDSLYQKIKWYYSLPASQKKKFRQKAIVTCNKYFSKNSVEKLILKVYTDK
ncbi:MAG: glycosyltransferase [Bacteroidetes bacterium]|nr:MAG: glycosyltransferase [Bacteroidota bacterium]